MKMVNFLIILVWEEATSEYSLILAHDWLILRMCNSQTLILKKNMLGEIQDLYGFVIYKILNKDSKAPR